ncbi:hypothetical protein TRFO_03034 [Tritrichomonas foetus]|uniref:Uncharacterized protein n=1 Tax=Tritrichomonas foetus TaxID=1144522 RepID=A0A1J4KU18_9EUKA|nr:hypothetical protein TRFO_03034 [Tritrichomonas foetus]|eukprot:OHT14759.1 hypothetical protein TRFO_03034 [Tritrichomonas foetus]
MKKALQDTFNRRCDRFIQSLERVITSVASDKYIRQMFEDQRSAIYIPDRICELIDHILADDREEVIFELMRKIKSIEYFFDKKYLKKIEEIGAKHIDDINNKKQTSKPKKDMETFYNILSLQLKAISGNNEYKELKSSLKDIKFSLSTMESDFQRILLKSKQRAIQACQIYQMKIEQIYSEKLKRAKFLIKEQRITIERLSANTSPHDSPRGLQFSNSPISQGSYDSPHLHNSPNSQHSLSNSSNLIQENERLKEKLQNSEKQVSISMEMIMQLQQQLINLKDDFSIVQGEKNQLEIANNDFSNLNSQLEEKIKALKQEILLFTEENNLLKLQNEQKIHKSNYHNETKNDFNDNDSRKSYRSQESDKSHESHRRSSFSKSFKFSSKEFENHEILAIMEKLQNDKKQVIAEFKLLRKENESLKKSLEYYEKSLMKTSEKNKKLENQIYLLNEEYKSMKTNKLESAYNENIEKLNTKINHLKEHISIIQKQNDEMQAQINNQIVNQQSSQNQQKISSDELLSDKFKENSRNNINISNLKKLFGTSDELELFTKISALYAEKTKVSELLHRSIYSDQTIPINSLIQTQNAIMSLLHISDSTKIISEIQILQSQSKAANISLESSQIIKDIEGIICNNLNRNNNNLNNSFSEIDLKESIRSLVRHKQIFETLCSNCGLTNDASAIQSLQKSFQSLKEISEILNVKTPQLLKSSIQNLVENQKYLQKACNFLKITDESSLLDIISNLLDIKNHYNEILKKLNIIDESKLFNKMNSFIQDQVILDEICDELNSDKTSIHSEIEKLQNIQKLHHKVISLLNLNLRNSDLKFDAGNNSENSLIKEIQGLIRCKKALDKLNIESNDETSLMKEIQSLIDIKDQFKEITALLSNISQTENNSSLLSFEQQLNSLGDSPSSFELLKNLNQSNPSHKIRTMNQIIKNACNILNTQDFNLCQSIRYIQNYYNTVFDILKISDSNELSKCLNEQKNCTEKINSIFQAFKVNDINHLMIIKDKIESMEKNLNSISKVVGKPDHEIESYLIDLNYKIDETSLFFKKLLTLIIGSSFCFEINFPLSKQAQNQLFSIVSEYNVKNEKNFTSIERIFNKACSHGYSGENNIEVVVDFLVDETHNKLSNAYSNAKNIFEMNIEQLKSKYKEKVRFLKKQNNDMKKSLEEDEKTSKQEILNLRKQLNDINESLLNEKKIHQELITLLDGKVADSEYLKTKLSAKEFLLLAKAEKTRKFVAEMTKKKEEAQHLIEMQKKIRETAFEQFPL